MKKEEIKQLKTQLELLLEELAILDESSHEAADVVELDQSRVGRLSRMDALQGQAMSQEAQRRRDMEKQQIEAALKRIENGEYGECQNCGEFIAVARLRASPAVRLCIACAE